MAEVVTNMSSDHIFSFSHSVAAEEESAPSSAAESAPSSAAESAPSSASESAPSSASESAPSSAAESAPSSAGESALLSAAESAHLPLNTKTNHLRPLHFPEAHFEIRDGCSKKHASSSLWNITNLKVLDTTGAGGQVGVKALPQAMEYHAYHVCICSMHKVV